MPVRDLMLEYINYGHNSRDIEDSQMENAKWIAKCRKTPILNTRFLTDTPLQKTQMNICINLILLETILTGTAEYSHYWQ